VTVPSAEKTLGGNAGVDPQGRLIYRRSSPTERERLRLPGDKRPVPDTAPIVRFDLRARRFDTLAFVHAASPRVLSVPDTAHGGVWFAPVLNPLPVVDEWAVLLDGRVAIVRGADYHLEVVDGMRRSTHYPAFAMPHVRLSRAERAAVIEGSRALRARLLAQRVPLSVNSAPMEPLALSEDASILVGVDDASATNERELPPVIYASPDELPSYRPAFGPGALRLDARERLWIRTLGGMPGESDARYDLVSERGAIVEQVRVPRDATIAGFGSDGAVFLVRRDTNGGVRLSRVYDR
jgi:hypothetical protein